MLGFFKHALLALVVVVIDNVGSDPLHRNGRDHLKVRILRFNRFVELRVTPVVRSRSIEIVFIADLDVAQRECRGMPIACAHRAPLRVRCAGDVLDFVKPLLHVGIEIGSRLDQLSAQRVSGVDAEQRLHVQVLAPLQEFQESHSVARVIAPRGRVCRTIDQRSDHLLPIEARLDAAAFEVIAAWKAQERGTHRGQLFHDVDAIAVGATMVGRREQRDHLKPQRPGTIRGQLDVILRARSGAARLHFEFVLLPRIAAHGGGCAREHLPGLVRHECNLHRQRPGGIGLCVE